MMNDIKKLKLKLKKIVFRRYDSHKVKSLKESWRRPKRRSTRARLELKGKIRLVKIGYRSPKELRNKTLDGKDIVYVNSISQLSSLDPKKHALIVANLGKKKKIELLKKIVEMKFEVLNYDPQVKLNELEESFKSKVEKRKEFEEERKKKLEAEESKEKKVKKEKESKRETKKEEKSEVTEIKSENKVSDKEDKKEEKSETKNEGNEKSKKSYKSSTKKSKGTKKE